MVALRDAHAQEQERGTRKHLRLTHVPHYIRIGHGTLYIYICTCMFISIWAHMNMTNKHGYAITCGRQTRDAKHACNNGTLAHARINNSTSRDVKLYIGANTGHTERT